ncbi:MAG TPA: PIG-L family deacetylase [Actinomycetota bacterium]|nr:PIG-L family deacetylase [Actinomycetota bacterium]
MEFERALVVFAHPDDAEFLCGGTVARWTQAGADVAYVCATDGSAGWNGPDLGREDIARTREREMREAADILGVHGVTFLGYSDGTLHPTLELRRDVTREVRRHRPDVVVTFDPSMRWMGRRYINHPDHRAIGDAVLAVAACDAPTRPQFPELLDEGLDPFEIPALWLATTPRAADVRVDIAETLDLKVKALKAHASQIENMGANDIDERMRRWAAEAAEGAEMEYAEAFRTFTLSEAVQE